MKYFAIFFALFLAPLQTMAIVVPEKSSLQIYDTISPTEVAEVQYKETDVDFTTRNSDTSPQRDVDAPPVDPVPADESGEYWLEDLHPGVVEGERGPVTPGIEYEDIGIAAPQETAASGFMKYGDIKGESTDTTDESGEFWFENLPPGLIPETDDEVLVMFEHKDFGPGAQKMNKADLIDAVSSSADSPKGKIEIEWKIEEGETAKKPKEIVVVGSKVHESLPSNGKVEVRGWDPVDKEAVLKHETVHTDDDVTLYMTSLVADRPEIVALSVSEEDTKLAYTTDVKLFGFIPYTMRGEVQIDFSNDTISERVKVRFPWFRIFATGDPDIPSITDTLQTHADELHSKWKTYTLDGKGNADTDDRPTEEVAFTFSKIKAEAVSKIVDIL